MTASAHESVPGGERRAAEWQRGLETVLIEMPAEAVTLSAMSSRDVHYFVNVGAVGDRIVQPATGGVLPELHC